MLTKSALGVYYAHNTRRIACVERVAAVMWARSSENAGDAGKKRARSSCPAKRSTRPWRSLQDRGSSGATSGENAGEVYLAPGNRCMTAINQRRRRHAPRCGVRRP